MKKGILGIAIGVAMAIIWSVCFVNILDSMAGIAVGGCLGVAFGISFTLLFSSVGKKNK